MYASAALFLLRCLTEICKCLLQAYEKFRSAAYKVVFRLRADRRIAAIRARLKQVGTHTLATAFDLVNSYFAT